MGRSKVNTKTTYFIVTSNGKLRQLNLTLITIFAFVLVGAMALFVKESYTLNQRLTKEEQQYIKQLTILNDNKRQLDQDLMVCEQKKMEIGNLLYFTTDSGKTADEK